MILDTTFVIDLLRGNPQAVALAQTLESAPIATTAITVYEVFQGAKDNELERLKAFFNQLTVHEVNRHTAEHAGMLQRELRTRGHAIDPEDAHIAAIALALAKPVVTRNKKHFSRVAGLGVQTY
jgi:predicted nucleic acid-binding protein